MVALVFDGLKLLLRVISSDQLGLLHMVSFRDARLFSAAHHANGQGKVSVGFYQFIETLLSMHAGEVFSQLPEQEQQLVRLQARAKRLFFLKKKNILLVFFLQLLAAVEHAFNHSSERVITTALESGLSLFCSCPAGFDCAQLRHCANRIYCRWKPIHICWRVYLRRS